MRTELVTTLKRQATQIIDELRTERSPIMITEHGKPAAYLVDIETYDAACRLVQRVFTKVDLLAANPQLGNIPKELKKTAYGRIVINPIYVYYRIEGKKVVIIFVDRAERAFSLGRITATD